MANSSAVSYNNADLSTNGPGGLGSAPGIGHSINDNENVTSPTSNSVVSFIASQFGRKHDDLKAMLDSTKDSQKLDAMKRIVGMMASGKDVSELFAAVVKNVVSKNIEVKKLVYVYLVRYAEEQQDLALLSIATFQKGLKDPNQLIRASALRVLSSIRVTVIVPIMMLALKEAVSDMSPYVRKTAANAIPKLFCLDPEQKEHLIEIIERLLQDKTTLVAGSTVIAFEEVCPERIDLIHKNYRKLCNMLIDIDEWGQVAVINMLVRYARTQFLDPNKIPLVEEKDAAFYPSSESEGDEDDDEDSNGVGKPKAYTVDPDHRLLLRSCLPLLKSRNAAVVMAVAKVYHHVAPSSEVACVVKALVRLLRSHREVQTVVLSNIVTMSLQRKGIFEPFIRTFFVHASDPTLVKKLKLDILTNLATESNIPLILREFQTYVLSPDKDFAASTIQAIGRCASNIPEVGDTCLAGLIRMLSNRDENVVGESIIVIKKLLQMHQKDHSDVITHMAKLLDKVHVPMARASILWLIGEYSDRIPKISPDVLRKMAKSFISEDDIVKLQVLTLGAKLYVSNSKQTRTLCQYILQLAKYDSNYDIRDRARFIKFMLFPTGEAAATNNLKKKAKKIFLVEKPAPILESLFKDRAQYNLGSLSHMIDSKANGYQELPDFPDEQPDTAVRDVTLEPVWGNQFLLTKEQKTKETKDKKSFYSDSGEEGSSEEEEEGDEEEGDDDEESSEEESEESEEESEFDELSDSEKGSVGDSEEEKKTKPVAKPLKKKEESDEEGEEEEESEEDESEEEDSDEEESEEESSSYESESESETESATKVAAKKEVGKDEQYQPDQSQYDQLLDLDDFDMSTGLTNGGGHGHAPSDLMMDMESLSLDPKTFTNIVQPVATEHTKSYDMLSKMHGKSLSASYRFTRAPCIYSRNMIGVEITLSNQRKETVNKLHVAKKKLAPGSSMQEFPEIESLNAGECVSASIGIDSKDTMQPVSFELRTETDSFPVTIKLPVGELVSGVTMTENEFSTEKKKLTGMTESSLAFSISATLVKSDHDICKRVLDVCNVSRCPAPSSSADGNKMLRFGGKLVSSDLPVLITLTCTVDGESSSLCVNCEKISLTSNLAKELKTVLTK